MKNRRNKDVILAITVTALSVGILVFNACTRINVVQDTRVVSEVITEETTKDESSVKNDNVVSKDDTNKENMTRSGEGSIKEETKKEDNNTGSTGNNSSKVEKSTSESVSTNTGESIIESAETIEESVVEAVSEIIVQDTTPPVLRVPESIEVYVGDTVSYKSQAEVSDDSGEEVKIDVDANGVNLTAVGVYSAIYTATDKSGNTSTATMQVIVKELSINEKEAEVQRILENLSHSIMNDSMDNRTKAKKIYDYVKTIRYEGNSPERDLYSAGLKGFTKGVGDCYITYACAKLLLDYCGIPNVPVERLRLSENESHHYWLLVNLGTGWYHFDAGAHHVNHPFNSFMRTDEEVENYSISIGRSEYYRFDKELFKDYPREAVPFS